MPPVDALLTATLAGLAVGVERQWSGHASGPHARFGGLRTFTLIGLVSGIAGWWLTAGLQGPATVLLAGLVAIIAIAYTTSSRSDIDATTEVAGLVVIVAGVLAGMGHRVPAAAITAITVLLLAQKSQLHALVSRIGETELIAAARFGAMATVVLPLLPSKPLLAFGPFEGIRIRELWMLVLFFSGISFLGYLARRAFGPRSGYAIAGALGGLVSSTSVTLTFSRLSREPEQDGQGRALAAGVMGANVMLFPRIVLASAVLAPPLAEQIWPLVLGPVAVGILLLARGVHDDAPAAAPQNTDENPLALGAALQMAVAFQVVLFVVSFADAWFGAAGLLGSATVLGLTDVDALTVSMAQQTTAGTDAALTATALLVGVLSNTVFKASLALTLGRGRYRKLATAGLVAMAVALGGGLLLRASAL